MSRSTTPAYRYEMVTTGNGECTPAAWNVGGRYGYGRPTAANLEKFLKAFEESTKPGGCNAHLGTTVVFSAKIIHQASHKVVATYRGPSFVVV
jgi:hypothetical protein